MPERKSRWREGSGKRDFYTVLGVERGADEAAIKKAYRSAALRWHPDKNRGGTAEKEAESRFKEIAEAYDVLGDADKKRAYDALRLGPSLRHHHSRAHTFHYSPRSPLDVFKEFFGTRDPFDELFADFFGNHQHAHHDHFFPRKRKEAFFAGGVSDEENDENVSTTFSFTSGKPGEAAAARKTSTSTKHVDGKKIVTRKTEENGKETVEVTEDGFLTSRIVRPVVKNGA